MSEQSATQDLRQNGSCDDSEDLAASPTPLGTSGGSEEEVPQAVLPEEPNKVQARHALQMVWKALNTPFVLFLLSSVVVSVCSYLVATWRGADQQSRERIERVRILDLEIKNRLEIHAARLMATDLDAIRARSRPFSMRVKAFYLLERPHLSEIPMTIVHEFSGHALSSLLLELETLVVSGEEKEELTRALIAIQGLKTFSIIFASMVDEEIWEETLDLDLNCETAFRPTRVRPVQGQIEDTLCDTVAWFRDPGITATLKSLNLERWGKPFDGRNRGSHRGTTKPSS